MIVSGFPQQTYNQACPIVELSLETFIVQMVFFFSVAIVVNLINSWYLVSFLLGIQSLEGNMMYMMLPHTSIFFSKKIGRDY